MAIESAPIDLLNLLLVLTLAWTLGSIAQRLGYPALMGELLAGIVFGPALLGVIQPAAELEVLAELGVFLLMVYVGMEVDIHDLFALGPLAVAVAVGGLIVPFGVGYLIGDYLGLAMGASLFIGIAMAATSLATKSRILVDLDILDTRIANVLLGGALISDVGILVAFAGVIGFIEAGEASATAMGLIMIEALAFFAIALVVGDRVLPYVWEGLEELRERWGFMDKTAAFTIALMVALAFAEFATVAGLHNIIGGFVAGLFLRQAELQEQLYEHMYNVIYDLAIGFFAPIFFVTVAFDLTLDVFTADLGLLALIVAAAFATKIVGTYLFSVPTRLTHRESFVIGLGMNGRGTVEIIIASIGLSAGVIDQSLFSILVFMAILTTALVPPTMKWGVEWLESNDELVRTQETAEVH